MIALAALVATSTFVHWLAARQVAGLWIMPDEAIYGRRALDLWQHGSLPLFGDSGAGYSAVYPLFAGGPLSIGGLDTGYALLKPVQALVMSLAAWPVYAYTRRVASVPDALLAAALTLACPLVLFSGFLMTEVLYYPLAAAALLAAARAIATARLADQLVALALIAAAVATRVQGAVLLAVFALAVLVDAAMRREVSQLRRFWPVWALTALGAVTVVLVPGVFGAYETAVNGSYDIGPTVRLTYDHLAYLILSVGVIPAAALVLLAIECIRGRERSPLVRALVAVVVCAAVLVVLQVGAFSSRFSPHLLGRDLAALPPVVFVAFGAWLGRGGPRPRVAASVTAVALLAILVTVPWDELASWDALPDTLGIALLLGSPFGWQPATVVAVVAAAFLVLFRFAPRAETAAIAVILLLGWATVAAADRVHTYSVGTQSVLVGEPRDWVDRAAGGAVTYVYDGDFAGWPVVWEQLFWNRRITNVVSIAPNLVPGPVAQRQIAEPPDGRLPSGTRYAVANDGLAMVGTPVAHQDRGPNQSGLTLWRLDGRPRLSTVEEGFLPNGDMPAPATVTAFACTGGSLELTLLPKDTHVLEVALDARIVLHVEVAGQASWHGSIEVPSDHGPGPCTFRIAGDGLLGSTRVDFVRPS